MRITRLALKDWRNIEQASLDVDSRFIVLHGNNAQGKTNLLEAIYTLATLRSFREKRPRQLIRTGEPCATIEANVEGDLGKHRLQWQFEGSERTLKLEGSAPSSLQDWFNPIRVVLFCPDHIGLVRGQPILRRQFIDRARFTAAPTYLDVVRSFKRTLRQKSALLKRVSVSDAELDVWNRRFAKESVEVIKHRKQMISEIKEPFQRIMKTLSETENVDLTTKGLGSQDLSQQDLVDRMDEHRQEERRRKMVLVGPHRDDLDIWIDNRLARNFASQGQARSIVLALKLAEIQAAKNRGQTPMFLLDDLTGELDQDRMKRLTELLLKLDNQVWITTTDPAHLGGLPADVINSWCVREGSVSRDETPCL